MIKICWITSSALYFTDKSSREYLKARGIEFTFRLLSADILLTSNQKTRRFKILNKLLFFKKFVLWTNEPGFDTTFENFRPGNLNIMNVYSKNVFIHNLHFLGSYHYFFKFNLGIDLYNPPSKLMTIKSLKEKINKCICIYGYRDPIKASIVYDGNELSLNKNRQDTAIFLQKKGMADIMGKGWPEDVVIKEQSGYDSGKDQWWINKIDILKKYKFNICLENTAFPYYCTEKIWQSIAGECLPVYSSAGTAIYETFPQNSFVDLSQFKSNEHLYDFLQNMSDEEYVSRYNKCLAVLKKSCVDRLNDPNLKTDILENFTKEIHAFHSNG